MTDLDARPRVGSSESLVVECPVLSALLFPTDQVLESFGGSGTRKKRRRKTNPSQKGKRSLPNKVYN